MAPTLKVGTCCYCGTRAALVLGGGKTHELQCGTCGAPLSRLKMLPTAAAGGSAPAATPPRPAVIPRADFDRGESHRRSRKRKKIKSFKRKIWSEVWDAIEDILD